MERRQFQTKKKVVKVEAEDDESPSVEQEGSQLPIHLAGRSIFAPPKIELKFTSRDEVPMISPANFGAAPLQVRFPGRVPTGFQRAPPPLSSLAHLIPTRRGKKTLWLFLLEMLTDQKCKAAVYSLISN